MSTDRLVVYNPESRAGRRVLERVAGRLAAQGERSRPRFVALAELERFPAHPARIIAIGGDGTLSAICDWMLRRDLRIPLAIIPAGTGNNLARGLGIARALPAALETALAGREHRSIDAVAIESRDEAGAVAGGRFMVQTAALGFPAEIAGRYARARASRWRRLLLRPLGTHAYTLLAGAGILRQKIREWRRAERLRCRIDSPEGLADLELLALFIGNERSLGGNFLPSPRAALDDGLVDLCAVTPGESYLRLFRAMGTGEHLAFERAVHYRQTAGPATLHLSRPAPLMIDGDVALCGTQYRLEVLPRRIDVIIR